MKKKNAPFTLPGLEGLSPAQKLAYLRDNARDIVKGKYFREYSEEDLAARKDEFTDGAIRLMDVKDEFKAVKAEFAGKIKKAEAEQGIIISDIRSNGQYTDGETFLFDDQDAGYMYTMDAEGNEIARRRLRPDEKQTSVLTVSRESNDRAAAL